MKINLRDYATELRFWLDAFKSFVDRESVNALSNLQGELESGRDNLRSTFPWRLAKPIKTKVADQYDGSNRTPHRVWVGWQFDSVFECEANTRKNGLWTVQNMVTHVRVHAADDGTLISHFHFDMKGLKKNKEGGKTKSKPQLGPHIHLQVSEGHLQNNGRIPLSIPRFPITTLLPTDCLDLVLSEFFPFDWPKSQLESPGRETLRSRQRERLERMSQAIANQCKESRNTPIVASQDWYAPDLRLA